MTNQSTTGDKPGVSRRVAAAVIVFVLAVAVFATTAFAQMVSTYSVEIAVNSTSTTITTNETEPIEILSQANISLNDTDKLDISSFEAGKGGVIKVSTLKTVNVEFKDVITAHSVYSNSVGEALDEIGLNTDNVDISCAMTDNLVDNMLIEYKSSKSTKLKVDGETHSYPIVNGTVNDLIEVAGIELGEDDYTVPSLDTKLKSGMTVKVNRVTYKEVTKKEKINFKTVKKKSSKVYEGISTVTTKGKKGTANVTYEVKYVNGKKTEETVVDKDVVTPAKSQVVKVGTKETDGAEVKSNGVSSSKGYKVGQVIKGRYTHYCACGKCGTGTGKTASGKRVSNGMKNPYYIACNWLPMGSIVNIDGTNYTVVDRGGSGLSREGRVDIFTPEGHKACYRYGTGSCTLTIMRLGW